MSTSLEIFTASSYLKTATKCRTQYSVSLQKNKFKNVNYRL